MTKTLCICLCVVLFASAHVWAGQVTPDWTSISYSPFNLTEPRTITNPVLTADDVTDVVASSVADPFLFHENGLWYMFLEVYNMPLDRGEIGLATSPDGLHWDYEQIVLFEDFHLSYPQVFKYDEKYYMIPETGQVQQVRLYESTAFPYSWQFVTAILSGRSFADPSIFRYNGLWWLFVTHGSNAYCYLYYSTSLSSGWVKHPKSPVVTGDSSKARPGGRSFVFDGDRIIRIAQKDNIIYGEQVRAFEVDTLTTTDYAEHEIPESPILDKSGVGWNASGMHQFDPWWMDDHWLCAVDGQNGGVFSIGIYLSYPPLSAQFSGSPTNGTNPLTVYFTDQSAGDITEWFWDFGDGATSTEKNPTHTYHSEGTFTVSLTVSGPEDSDTIDKTDYISVAAPALGATVIVPDDYGNVQDAVAAVENDADPGEVIINNSDTFDETVLIQQSVTIRAGDKCSPVIERTSGWQAPIRISATQDSDTVVVLQGITVRTDASGEFDDFDGITISNVSSSNTLEVMIDNVTVDAKESQSAIIAGGGAADTSLTITNSFIQIEGMAAGSPKCVRLAPSAYNLTAVLRNNTFRFSRAGGIDIQGGNDDQFTTTTIDANLFEGFSSASGVGRTGIEISGTGAPGNNASPTNTTITNNLFLRTTSGIEVNGQQLHTHTASINNNTIVDSSVVGMDLVAYGDSTLIVSVYNNIITGTSNGYGGYGMYRYEASNGVVNLTNDYNLLFDNESGNYSGATAGPHALAVDPQFMDPGTDNYRLQASSPAIDSGVNSPLGGLGAERDLDGSARVQDGDGNATNLCDRGAYEKGSIVLTILPTATEGDGILAGEGTVTISDTLDSALVVCLVCSDTTEVTVPATVTVAAGHTEASFDLTIVDDSEIDGTQTVTVTGSAVGWASGSGTIEVEDDELGGGGNGGCFIATAGS